MFTVILLNGFRVPLGHGVDDDHLQVEGAETEGKESDTTTAISETRLGDLPTF